MTETVNDEETITMALTTPCPTPELAFTVDSIEGMTVHLTVTKCNPGAGHVWKPNSLNISGEDDNAINNLTTGKYDYTFRNAGTHTLFLIGQNDCGKVTDAKHNVTVTVVAPPAQGDITGVDYPASIPKGKVKFNVTADYKNVGGSSGTFYLQIGLWVGTHWFDLSHPPSSTLAAGATGTQAFVEMQSPEIGSSLTVYKMRVRMIQIT